ncbi:MAG: hypothetical protein ACJAYC_002445 [Halieaceae bacterium]|jgi:hypothetical protein
MSLRPGIYLPLAAAIFLLVCAVNALYHYRADRWGVFASDYESFHSRILVNKLYLKTRYLVDSKNDSACYAFGSSRLAAIPVWALGNNCYNFTHSGGLVVDHLRAVKTLLDNGIPIDDLFIALDDLSYNKDPYSGELQLMRRAPPRNWLEWLGFVRLFLLRPLDIADLGLVTGHRVKQKTPRFIIDPDLDTARIRDVYQKFKVDPSAQDAKFRKLKGMDEGDQYYGQSTIAALDELKSLSEEHGFRLHAMLLPLHYKTYLTRNYGWLYEFKEKTSAILPFHDFSGLHRFAIDNRYWRETSHFSAEVGDEVVAVVTGDKYPEGGIGRMVTPQSLAALEADQQARDAVHIPELARREGLMALPTRFLEDWSKQGLLMPLQGKSLAVGGVDLTRSDTLKFERGNTHADRLGAIQLPLRAGDFFVLGLSLESDSRSRLRIRLSHDEAQYLTAYREQALMVEAGGQRATFIGYASVDRPTLRVIMGGGDFGARWQAINLQKLDADWLSVLRSQLPLAVLATNTTSRH